MRRIVVACLVACLIGALAPLGRTDTSRLSLVRVPVSSRDEATYLVSHFDETHNHRSDSIELLLWPGDAARLEASGFDYEIVVEDLVRRDLTAQAGPRPLVRLPGPDRTDYRHLVDYESEMKTLARKNPALVRLIEFPHETREGRTVYGIEISAGVRRIDGRPTFYIDGVHHAREWPAAEYPMIFAHHLVSRFGREARVTRLLKRLRVVIVPVVNPDGFDYSREALVQEPTLGLALGLAGLESYWRKNRRSLSGVTAPAVARNPDAYGVDPNRNYGFMWGDDVGGSSGLHLDQTYRGNEPFSEPETQNIREIILSRHVTGVITNHTYGRLVLRAWGHTSKDAPDEAILKRLGDRMAEAMGRYASQKGIALYATTGTTDDWSYSATAGLGFTFEHGSGFHPPYADGVGDVKGVMKAFLMMARAAANPKLHSVVTGRAVNRRGRPVEADLYMYKRWRTPLWPGNPTGKKSIRESLVAFSQTDRNGRFVWHVNPSTRPLLEAKGKREKYRFVVARGKQMRHLMVSVDRGERLDLGTIKLGPAGIVVVLEESVEAIDPSLVP